MTIRALPVVTKDILLIGISGKAHSGKDTVASFLYENYPATYSESFATPLKKAAAACFGIASECFNNQKWKEQVNDYWGVSPRKIAQFFGTEVARDTFANLLGPDIGTDFWIKRLTGLLNGDLVTEYDDDYGEEYSNGDTVVIPDVRFQNEYDWILANGGVVIHLSREGADGSVGIPGHQSEGGYTRLVGNERTYEISNNGTLEELYEEVKAIMTQVGKIPG
jgi:hypothetical protein